MAALLTAREAIGPMRSGPWWVPVIVERQATVSPSPISSVDLEVQVGKCLAQRRDHLLQVGGEVGPRRFLVADGAWSDDEWAGWLRATLENALLEP